ncbi:transcription termination factor, mitochondrial-like [Neocloeon triangulifer]|uniref:transcription termination factor, mitochondrial-like n=1 Tax=Neocloeon triangulifer TaxID=2078957 RepID=UPI00286ED0F3|nr:transcription termination factor, mitochondrial-like [Neocloeon triangulifer]
MFLARLLAHPRVAGAVRALPLQEGLVLRTVYMSNNLEVPAHYEGASEHLSHVLGCSKQESCAILMEFPEIKKLNTKHLKNTCQYLTKDLGLEPRTVLDFPWLLQYSKQMLKSRMDVLLVKTQRTVSSMVPLLRLDAEMLKKMFAKSQKLDEIQGVDKENQDRITFLSRKLKCSELEACDIISKNHYLLNTPLARMEKVFEVLYEYQIDPIDVMKDPWILRYNPEQIRSRLEIIKSVGMDKAKPWLARSSHVVFKRSLEKYKRNEELLGKSMTKLDFVQKVFQLSSKEDAVEMARKYPVLLRLSAVKLNSGIETLLKAGITRQEIVAAPRVLAYSSKLVIKRHELLRSKYNVENPNLNVLVRSSSMFHDYLKKLDAQMAEKEPDDL